MRQKNYSELLGATQDQETIIMITTKKVEMEFTASKQDEIAKLQNEVQQAKEEAKKSNDAYQKVDTELKEIQNELTAANETLKTTQSELDATKVEAAEKDKALTAANEQLTKAQAEATKNAEASTQDELATTTNDYSDNLPALRTSMNDGEGVGLVGDNSLDHA